MNIRKLRATSWILGTGAAVTTLAAMTFSASGATEQSTFTNHYNQNLQLEAQLLQTAKAEGGSNATINAYSTTVQNLNTQISALYTVEQTLATMRSSLPGPSSNAAQIAKWKAQRQQLQTNIAEAREKIKADYKAGKNLAARNLELQIKTWYAEINQINFQLNHSNESDSAWQKHPYGNGLGELQESIFDLQKSAIHYTEAWIAAAKPSASTGDPASISGLAYATASILRPAPGLAAVTDGVAVMPIVKDAAGNVLVANGSFTLSGPSGFSGVSIDSTTGQVSVNPGATPGTYVVKYTQGNVSQSVSIVIS